jgi:hypothetical protein
MDFGGVKTNIESLDQYNDLIKRICEWFIALKHPGYKLKNISQKEE